MSPEKSTKKTGTFLSSKFDKDPKRSSHTPSSSRNKPREPSSRPSPSTHATQVSRNELAAPSSSSSRRERTEGPGTAMRPLDSRTITQKSGTVMRPLDDAAMATRQLTINKLSGEDRQIQQAWAQSKIQILGVCPADFEWLRSDGLRRPSLGFGVPREPDCGYRCVAGGHYISDKELASGKTAKEILAARGNVQYTSPGLTTELTGLRPIFPRPRPRPPFSDPYSRKPW